MKKLFSAVIILFISVTLVNADGIFKRIKFEKGKSSFIFNGAVVGGDTDTYIFRASKGQTLEVSITSVQDNATFTIVNDKTEKVLDGTVNTDSTSEFSKQISINGDYKILVTPSKGNASYKLKVELNNPYFEF